MNPKKWLWLAVQDERWRLILPILFSLVTAGCTCALTFTSGYLISKSALRPENILMIYVPIVLVRAFGIGKAVSRYVERLVSHHMVLRMVANMRVTLYQILEPQALFVRSRYRTGELLSTLADDIEHLQDFYIRTLLPTLVAIVIFALGLFGLGMLDFSFALIMGVGIGSMILIFPMISLGIYHRKQRKIKRWKNRLYPQVTDAILGIQDWMISGHRSTFLQNYRVDEAKGIAEERSLRRFQHWRMFLLQCLVGIMALLVIEWMGQQVANDQLSVALIAAGVLAVFPLMDLFLPVSDAIEKVPQYQDSIHRLDQIDQRESSTPVNRWTVSKEKLSKAKCCADLRVENVLFYYDQSRKEGIEQLSLHLPPGKKVAILGKSGAGKSTLIKLIRGDLIPERGRVTINGTDVHCFGDEISQVISVCEQRPHLFDTTVANNIRLGDSNASEESICEAVRRVKLDGLLKSLPLGDETPMLEMGSHFSGGERQRIALARILLQDTPIVILDEPTVGLDPKTERELIELIFDVFQEKTVIWITHHLLGMEQMDEIIFLENGRVAMRGSHAVLYAQHARYRRLYQLDRPQ